MAPTSHSGLLKFQQERSWLAVIVYTCCASLFYASLTLTVLVNFLQTTARKMLKFETTLAERLKKLHLVFQNLYKLQLEFSV